MKRQMSLWLGGVLSSTFLVSCVVPGSGVVLDVSGLQGVTLRGPVCPGPVRVPPVPGCVDVPVSVSLKILSSDGTLVTRFKTAQDGTFKVNLAPGRYTVSSDQAVISGRIAPVPVTVMDQTFTTVELHLDSGIR